MSDKPRYDISTVMDYDTLINADYQNLDFVKPGLKLGTVGSLVSAGGIGKSYKALQDAMFIAAGRDYKKGGALYLAAEDSSDDIGKRMQEIKKAFQFTEDESAQAGKNFKLWPLVGSSPDLLEKAIEDEDSQPLVDAICKIAQKFENDPLRIIFFDTLRRFSYAEENDGGQMAKILSVMEKLCKRLHCSCLFLHHSTKSAALSGQMNLQQAARGSSVLTDNIRYQEYMRPMSEDEAEKLGEVIKGKVLSVIGGERSRFVEWGISKQNHGSPVKPVWLKKNESGVLLPVELGNMKNQNGRRQNDVL